ncbi:hypothetical protein Hanom_Chr12g01142151 [Helianthus anomalus]
MPLLRPLLVFWSKFDTPHFLPFLLGHLLHHDRRIPFHIPLHLCQGLHLHPDFASRGQDLRLHHRSEACVRHSLLVIELVGCYKRTGRISFGHPWNIHTCRVRPLPGSENNYGG